MMTLKEAIHLAQSGKSANLERAASCLSGLPIGGWGETVQARMDLHMYLPARCDRLFTIEEWIGAVYEVAGGRYRSRIWDKHREGRAARLEREAERLIAEVPPFRAEVEAGEVTVRLDREGFIETQGARHEPSEIEEIVSNRPEWLEAAKKARSAVLEAQEARKQVGRVYH